MPGVQQDAGHAHLAGCRRLCRGRRNKTYLGDKHAEALKVGGILLGVARILHAIAAVRPLLNLIRTALLGCPTSRRLTQTGCLQGSA